MLFNSYIFIFAFLPITLVIYWIFRRLGKIRVSLCFLIIASLFFYSYQDIKFGGLLLASIAVNYLIHLGLLKTHNKVRIPLLLFGLFYNLGILFYVKYLDFFILNINALSGSELALHNIVLPLGISFYTFQQISVVIDSYNRKMEQLKLWEYALFVSFFPQLIAGPIVLHSEMIPQFKNDFKTVEAKKIYEGLQYFILGMAKKLIIADTLGRGVDWGYSNILWLNSMSAVTLILLYTLQIYFDFSGYCDMAIGLGKLFGFEIAVNFKSPYRAFSVTEFWKKWHITLTRFLTTYLYIPLGGNRKGKIRTYINVLIVFAVSGLWHGANWTFVAWGTMHGVMMVLERMAGEDRLERLPKWFRFLYTFGFVNFAWVFFRANNFTDALNIFKRILHGGTGFILPDMQAAIINNSSKEVLEHVGLNIFGRAEVSAVFVTGFIIVALLLATVHKNVHEIVSQNITKKLYAVGLGVVFIISVIAISGVSTFLYFNF